MPFPFSLDVVEMSHEAAIFNSARPVLARGFFAAGLLITGHDGGVEASKWDKVSDSNASEPKPVKTKVIFDIGFI